jgi:hypothetical protein
MNGYNADRAEVEGNLESVAKDCVKVASALRQLIKDVRGVADKLASTSGVPSSAPGALRDIGIRADAVVDDVDDAVAALAALKENFGSLCEGAVDSFREDVVDERIDEALVERDRLADVVRERMDRRLHLALLAEERGGQDLYVKVSRTMASELEDVLAEGGLIPGRTPR